MSSPIADLSYRGYEGPLSPPGGRWKVIASMTARHVFRKRLFWVATLLSGWYFLVMIVILFFMQQVADQTNPQIADAFFERMLWVDQFMHAFGFGQLAYLIVALLVGAGAVANDNRSNALLVILSKPCSKKDYLIGKWAGVAAPLFVAMALPAAVFYFYGATSLGDRGFLGEDYFLLPKVMLYCALSAAFQSALVVGVSSLFKQGRIAGAVYAGIYVITNLFTQLMAVTFVIGQQDERWDAHPAVQYLFYGSIDGVQYGLAKAILGTDGTPVFGIDPQGVSSVPAPPLWGALVAAVVLGGLGLLLAWKRIHAVEVVR